MRGENLVGQTFALLYVLSRAGTMHKDAAWLCRCDCGAEKICRGGQLRKGKILSCGCSPGKKGHNLITHGLNRTPLHQVWLGIRSRTTYIGTSTGKNYADRGITLCSEWQDFLTFKAWAESNGYQPHLQIDRIDNDGNYTPSNCRFTTPQVNSNNRRSNVWLEYKGERKTIADWARDSRCVVSYHTLWQRLTRLNMPLDIALTAPLTPGKRVYTDA